MVVGGVFPPFTPHSIPAGLGRAGRKLPTLAPLAGSCLSEGEWILLWWNDLESCCKAEIFALRGEEGLLGMDPPKRKRTYSVVCF